MIYHANIESSTAGYTQAGLLYLAALASQGRRDVTIVSMGEVINWREMPPWARDLGQMGAAAGISRDVCVTHHLPSTLTAVPLFGEKRNIGLTVVETHEVPRWLCSVLDKRLQGLIVPTHHNRNAFRAGGFKGTIAVIEHPMVESWWKDAPPPAPRDGSRPFTFYYIGNWNVRKNPEGVLRAYLRAFPDPKKDNVALALKLTAPRSFEQLIRAILIEETGSDERYDQDVWPFIEGWSEDRIRWLHSIGDCFVSAHRGEGWGLGLFQAALLGRPVVYTNWSAPPEYLSMESRVTESSRLLMGTDRPGFHYPVTYALAPCGLQGGNMEYFYPSRGQRLLWAEPDLEDFGYQMQAAYRDRDSVPLQAGLQAHAEWMRATYGADSIGRGFNRALECM